VPTPTTRWSDDVFLDTLRNHSDPLADQCVAALPRDESLAFLFTKLHSEATEPAVLPDAFVAFCRNAHDSLDLSDLSDAEQRRLARGQEVFMTTTMPVALVLLAKSLQEGYQAPRLGKVLMISGELEGSTYRRVLGVLQMLIAVASPGSYAATTTSEVLPASEAALTAIKIRLMHAGLRGIAHGKFPNFARNYGGEPLSLEDMLATLIAFSSLVVDGLETLHVPMTPEDADAYHAIWRVFARCMGIHPPGEPKSFAWIPANIAEAREFYAAYARRHYAPAERNAEGVMLAAANLRMLAGKMPPLAARIYMRALMGRKASEALGIRAVPLMFLWKFFLLNFPRVWVSLWRALDRGRADGVARHIDLSRTILQRLIVLEYKDNVPALRVPRDASEIRQVVRGTSAGLEFGRQQFAREVFPAELTDIRARREALDVDATALQGPPSTRQGLVGLALSGGGIRSAAFSLGAVQAMARRRCLRAVDYLSTVSGGGYIGAAISSVLNTPDARAEGREFAFNSEAGEVEPPAVRHVRSGSNYLAGDGLLQSIRLPMVLMRGIMLNTVLFLPYLMLAALATWICLPWIKTAHIAEVLFWGTLVAFLGVVISYPSVAWLRHRLGVARTWQQRNRTEALQASALLAFLGSLLFSMVIKPIDAAVTGSWGDAKQLIVSEFRHPAEWNDWWKWLIVGGIVLALLRVRKASRGLQRWFNRFLIYGLGLTGYSLMFATYLALLLYFARSPFLPSTYEPILSAAARAHAADPTRPARLDSGLVRELSVRGIAVDADRASVSREEYGPWTIRHTAADGASLPPVVISKSYELLEVAGLRFGERSADWWIAGAALLVFLLNATWVDINITSAHGYFRDRLSRVFLIRASWFGKTSSNDQLRLSELASENPAAPYHLVNTALNLAGSTVEDLPGRRSDFFMLSKRYIGSYATGYAATTEVETLDRNMNLGTAIAISAVAASPNAGTATMKPLVFLLTFLNVRLGYWIPNPWYVQATQSIRRLMVRTRPGPWYLLREALGLLDARSAFVNISDGGHMENLALYELLRRRCKLVIAVDGECDPGQTCPSLAKLIRYAQIDLGIVIDIDLAPLATRPDGTSAAHWTLGTITYGGGETGQLLYVKSSITGDDEPPYVIDYRRRSSDFPHESTADQFFDETQFESYRALGFHAMNRALGGVVAAPHEDPRSEQLRTVATLLG
jgi:hypothetical protein